MQKLLTSFATLAFCAILISPIHTARAQEKTKKSDDGFFFVKGLDPQRFEPKKFANDPTKKYQDFLKKIKDKKVQLCETVWNKEGPPKGKNWIFTCADECKEKGHFCMLQIVYDGVPDAATQKKFTIVEGKHGSITAPPKEFIDHVLLVYCECKKGE